MPAKNVFHDLVVNALIADGWVITADPLRLKAGNRDLYVDLGAERNMLAAERNGERIGVEVQSFVGASEVRNLQEALGQFLMYRLLMVEQYPDHRLFMAVPNEAYDGILSERLGRLVIGEMAVPLLVFDPNRQEALKWIK